jgi:hypothetical protein
MRLFTAKPKPKAKAGRPGGANAPAANGPEEKMTPGELVRIGTKFHGKEWHAALAEDIGSKYADVHFWAKGEEEIPRHVARFVRVLNLLPAGDRARVLKQARSATT